MAASLSLAIAAAAIASSIPQAGSLSLAFDPSSRSGSAFARSYSRFPGSDRRCAAPPWRRPGRDLQMKVSGSGKRSSRSKSSRLIEANNERLRTAGRRGTKRFVDPNKVFVGNLPYDAVEGDVLDLFARHWNVPLESVGERIESVKIIRDWRTGKSKGYGFLQFYEPMVATSAMESINKGRGRGWTIKGRRIRLDQGKRKDGDEDRIQRERERRRRERVVLDEEGRVIHDAALEAVGAASAEGEDDEEEGMSEDDMITFLERGGLRGIMPLTEEAAEFLGAEGLYEDDDDGDYFEEFYNENGYDDSDFEDGEEDGDDDEEAAYDGVFEEVYNPDEYEAVGEDEARRMNREQRRAAERKRKKRKLPFKGFGSPS